MFIAGFYTRSYIIIPLTPIGRCWVTWPTEQMLWIGADPQHALGQDHIMGQSRGVLYFIGEHMQIYFRYILINILNYYHALMARSREHIQSYLIYCNEYNILLLLLLVGKLLSVDLDLRLCICSWGWLLWMCSPEHR